MMHRVAIIGAGSMGTSHARAIAAQPAATLVAAARRNQSEIDHFAGEFACAGYTDYREILDRPDIDCVCIALPHDLHMECVIRAAEAGKHILLEKPMASSLIECDAIVSAVAHTRVKLMVGHSSRFAPPLAAARKCLTSGEIGSFLAAHATATKQWESARRREWHRDRARGGGVWLTNGIHVVDRLMWLVDRPVRSVRATLQTTVHTQAADDCAAAWLTFDNGSTAAAFVLGYRNGVDEQRLHVYGSNGFLRYDEHGLAVGQNGEWRRHSSSGGNWQQAAIASEWQAFLDYLDGVQDNPVPAEVGREVMRVVFAAEDSSARGREVHLSGD
jgi:predicted dehydrogenase